MTDRANLTTPTGAQMKPNVDHAGCHQPTEPDSAEPLANQQWARRWSMGRAEANVVNKGNAT